MLNVQRNHRLIIDGEKGVWRWGKGEIIYLSLQCHHQNDSCIKTGSDESHSNVSVEAALLSELEFKHQLTTAGGGRGGREGRMRAPRCRGVQKTGNGMERREGEV